MFCDLKGFSQYSEEHRAEVVVTDLNRYLGEMERTLFDYKAHIDKYMGDGIMVEFGALLTTNAAVYWQWQQA